MTAAQRQQLYDRLMEDVPGAEKIGVVARRQMEEIIEFDLASIEPLINQMISDAFEAGKRFVQRHERRPDVVIQL